MVSPKTQALPKKEIDKVEKHVFRVYDTNGDGFIDFVEFMVLFHILSEGSPNEVLSKIFRVFDVNSDGTINAKEMKRLIKDMYGLIKADDPEAQSQELIAKSAFAEMDEDKDYSVSEVRTKKIANLPTCSSDIFCCPGEDQGDCAGDDFKSRRAPHAVLGLPP